MDYHILLKKNQGIKLNDLVAMTRAGGTMPAKCSRRSPVAGIAIKQKSQNLWWVLHARVDGPPLDLTLK